MLKISEGRTAEIFEQEPGKILKLYRSGFPPEAIRYEYEMNQAIASCGVPAPRTYDLIHFEQSLPISIIKFIATSSMNIKSHPS
ncbi:hypothetical protein C8Z91_06410 [Paenibacillus elgii]|uniref:Aminoglycoside phosphotransferase domain-containing protein n=1 Tax=Paenibacillus elgii TaxID=189691 RepID=A0A2T6G7J5_9BACL|nr:hypothetical protein [Paenibacillus elgii]PUA40125.1 hypothetical protein C8Z91_06410 [Paenibacillus elgii]